MTEATTRTGGCHCGKVRYEVKTALEPLIACNCSICQKRGLVLTFVPKSEFHLSSGEGAQTDYQFGKKSLHHLFCPVCGVATYSEGTQADGTPTIAVNIRTLDHIDVSKLDPKPFDGKSM